MPSRENLHRDISCRRASLVDSVDLLAQRPTDDSGESLTAPYPPLSGATSASCSRTILLGPHAAKTTITTTPFSMMESAPSGRPKGEDELVLVGGHAAENVARFPQFSLGYPKSVKSSKSICIDCAMRCSICHIKTDDLDSSCIGVADQCVVHSCYQTSCLSTTQHNVGGSCFGTFLLFNVTNCTERELFSNLPSFCHLDPSF